MSLWASGPGQTLTGGILNDVLGGASNDTLIGGDGDNQYYLYGTGNVIVQGPGGTNTVTTWMSYTLPDNIQNLNVNGTGLYAAGNALDNLIKVGDANTMTLYGAGGSNVLVGGAGTDTFIIDGSAGSNAIYGWHAGDVIRLQDSSLKTFADVQAAMVQQGADVVFRSGQNDIVIRNATVSQFTASDFYLSLDRSMLGVQTFGDEFNGLSLRGASNPNGTWTTDYGYGGIGSYTLTGNGELQIYTAPGFTGTTGQDLGLNPFSVSGGVLDIHAEQVDAATSAGMWNYGYSSGVITTKQSFAQQYGYFEMRADLPEGVSGAWPAFWLVPADGSWPPELDVMETLSGSPNVDHTTVHSQATGMHTAVGSSNLVTDVGGYHTYGVLWTASTITWYLDGEKVFETATPADMNKPMYMIANMAVGGWAGTPDFTSADMKIDYIRAYALADGSSSWTSSAVVDSPAATAPAGDPSTGGSTSQGDGTVTVGSGSTTTKSVSVSDATYVAPSDVTRITLTGSHQAVTGNDAGDTFISNNTGNHLAGGAGADTFVIGRGGDTVTGGAGADTFMFRETPWAGAHITDFTAGQDTVDLTALLAASGYTGSDPVGAGYLKMVSTPAGAQIWSNLDHASSAGSWWLVATLDGVAASTLAVQSGVLGGVPSSSASTNPAPPSATVVSTSASAYTAAAGVIKVILAGSVQTVHGNDAGDTFVIANNTGNHLFGGAGTDTFVMGRGGDTVSGGAGADRFVFDETPLVGGHIADFTPGQDTIDLTGLLSRSGYAGSDPIGAGYVKIVSDGAGNAQVWSSLDQVAHAGWWLVTTLDGVSSASVHAHGAFISG